MVLVGKHKQLNNSIHIQNDIKDPIVAQLKMRSTKKISKKHYSYMNITGLPWQLTQKGIYRHSLAYQIQDRSVTQTIIHKPWYPTRTTVNKFQIVPISQCDVPCFQSIVEFFHFLHVLYKWPSQLAYLAKLWSLGENCKYYYKNTQTTALFWFTHPKGMHVKLTSDSKTGLWRCGCVCHPAAIGSIHGLESE